MRTSMLAAVAGLLLAPATATAANPVAESRAAWDRVAGSTFTLDQDALADVLTAADVRELTISVPAPDGGFERFEVVESPVMEPALAAAHPEIKTYTARGVDDPTASARLDLTPLGFHASVRSATGAWYVDPRDGDHVAHRRGAVAARPFSEAPDAPLARSVAPRAVDAGGGPVTLRVYRLALLSDPGFSDKTPEPTTTAAKTVVVNRLNQIFEQDLAVRLVLVAGTDQLNLDMPALASGTAGPCAPAACYTAAQLAACEEETLDRTNAVAGRILGSGSYDLAHLVIGDGVGGLASLGGVGGIFKGAACTAYDDPVGDPFIVDYLAHEIGHQFGAQHTFNSSICADNRAPIRAVRVEPGSGSSIMAYAGTCGDDNLQRHTDPYFSQASLAQVTAHVTSAEENEAPAQQVALNGFGTDDSFRLRYAGANSAVVAQGGNFTDDGIEAAIEAIPGWPGGADAFVYAVTPAGFTVRFSGLDAPARLEIVSPSGFPGGFAGVTAAGGLTRHGGSPQATGNRAPSVALTGAAAYTIPTRTPFLLDATGSDLDGDTLTYLWEQNDGGGGDTGIALFNGVRNGGPLFRIFGAAAAAAGPANAASTATSRSFPDIDQVLADNTNAATGVCPVVRDLACFSELLPTLAWGDFDGARTLHFRVTARDNHPGFGGTDFADVALAIAPGTGPFRLTSQAAGSTVGVGAALPVTWDVAGTAALAPEVRISLSLDGGRTFTKVLAAATPNDGAETVTVPRVTSANARVKIEGVGNVFYDAARGALAIDAGAPALLNGPASADLGSALVGDLGAPVTITFTSDGPTPVNTGVLAVGGADSTGVGIVSDGCSGRTLAAYSECAVAVRLTPLREGAHAATLTLPSNDPSSPATVALTGTGTVPPPAAVAATPPPSSSPAPTPPPTAFDPVQSAARLLGVRSPFSFGTAGDLRLFTKTKSAKLGKPKASMLLAAAVCAASPCSGKATARLTLTPRKGRKRSYNFNLVKSLKLAAGAGTVLNLKLSRADRKRIDAARKASLVLTITNGSRKVTRTFTLTT